MTSLERRPVRYAPRQLVGWEARRRWEPIRAEPFASLEEAQTACSLAASESLEWNEGVCSPEGHRYFDATSKSEPPCSWQSGPAYLTVREDIPGAEFVSADPWCAIYIEPKGEGWQVMSQYDFEGHDTWDLVLAGIAENPIAGNNMARLWHWHQADAENKELAMRYGRYLFGRSLVKHGRAPPMSSWLKSKLRTLAQRFV